MAKTLINHYGRINKGRKEYYNFPLYKKQIEALEGKEFIEHIFEKPKKVSADQHGYYRGGILGTCIKTEYFAHFAKEDDIHDDFFAPMFLSYTQRVKTPEKSYIITKIRSTADLTKKEFSEFIEKVIAWCAENDIEIGEPEAYYSRYYKTINK